MDGEAAVGDVAHQTGRAQDGWGHLGRFEFVDAQDDRCGRPFLVIKTRTSSLPSRSITSEKLFVTLLSRLRGKH